jgi:hypothetical protein
MDLISGIKPMENRLGGRRPNHGKEKSVPKNARSDAGKEKQDPEHADHASTEFDPSLGQKIDTTA